MRAKRRSHPENLIVISDLHAGCQLALCPPSGARLDEGGEYSLNRVQEAIWEYWYEFWHQWVPFVTEGQRYDVVVNGDAVDGVHHGSVHQITHNLASQASIACALLGPVAKSCIDKGGRFFMVRGTEAHTGPSGQQEESLAETLRAERGRDGKFARSDLRLWVGRGIVHCLHHIGTTGSMAYESSAVMAEMVASFAEAGRWHGRAPDCIVRSHRHRLIRVEVPAANNNAFGVVTPGWQGKTPYAYRIAGARQATPQFGGCCIKHGAEGLYLRHKVWGIDEGDPE